MTLCARLGDIVYHRSYNVLSCNHVALVSFIPVRYNSECTRSAAMHPESRSKVRVLHPREELLDRRSVVIK